LAPHSLVWVGLSQLPVCPTKQLRLAGPQTATPGPGTQARGSRIQSSSWGSENNNGVKWHFNFLLFIPPFE